MLSVAYSECHFMRSVTCKPYILSVVMLKVIMLSVVAPVNQPLLRKKDAQKTKNVLFTICKFTVTTYKVTFTSR